MSLDGVDEAMITRKVVTNAYKLYQSDRSNISANESQIIHILGGIDIILEEFLREKNDIQMTQNQLDRLHQLFITPETHQAHNKFDAFTKLLSLSHNEQYIDIDSTTHTFDETCTYLHQFLGPQIATKITSTLQCKWPHILLFILTAINLFLRFAFVQHIIYPLYTLIFCGFCTHFYVMIWLLSINKKGLMLVFQTFEFWLKCFYIIVAVVLVIVNQFTLKINGEESLGSMNHSQLRVASHIAMFSNCVFLIIIISMFDALHINRTSKVLCSVSFAVSITIMAIYNKYITYFNGNHSIIYVSNNIGLSLLSMQQNATEIIAIFSWKQAILTIIKKGKCVLIKHSPYIEWSTNVKKTVTVVSEHDDESVRNMTTMRYLPEDRATITEIAIEEDKATASSRDPFDTMPDLPEGLTIRATKSPSDDSVSISSIK